MPIHAFDDLNAHVDAGGNGAGGGVGGTTVDMGGQDMRDRQEYTANLAQEASTAVVAVAASAVGGNDDDSICLHGTVGTFTSLVDPATLLEADGSLGTIPMPDGRYTVLLMAASSVPVSVGIQLVGDSGLAYDRTFALADTGRPPSEDATMWDYNSGVAELVVVEPQVVNATATVSGGDGLPVFVVLARCR